MTTIATLSRVFGHLPGVHFALHGELPVLEITTSSVQAKLALQGAHLFSFSPTGQPDWLFCSERSDFLSGHPIRGGIPLVFPWFSEKANDDAAPDHGLGRTSNWDLQWIEIAPDGAVDVLFDLCLKPDTNPHWPAGLAATLELHLGTNLTLNLCLDRFGPDAVTVEAAFHTYLAVSDSREATVTGLESALGDNRIDGSTFVQQGPLKFGPEVDTIFTTHGRPVRLDDPRGQRSFGVESDGPSTVVWNPAVAKSRRLHDLAPDDWHQFVCVESGFVRSAAKQIEPGGCLRLRATYSAKTADPDSATT